MGWGCAAHHEGESGQGYGEEEGDEGGAEEETLRGPEREEAPRLLAPRRGEEAEVLFCVRPRRIVITDVFRSQCGYLLAHEDALST